MIGVMKAKKNNPVPGSFARGVQHEPPTEEDKRVGSFATGEETQPHDHQRRRRFSEGVEQLPDSPEKSAEGNFAEGA
jgi:hypothetical protein